MNSADQFEAIVKEHYEPLYRFAMSLTRVESDALDLTQQTFYVWATKGHQLRDISKVRTWLFTALHRDFLKARRRQIRFAHDDLEQIQDQLQVPCTELPYQLDCSRALPALARVDAVFQSAVALFYLEDLSYKDIAAILDVPIGTVKSRIARGVAQLREILLPGGSPGSLHVSADEPAASTEDEPPLPCRPAQLEADLPGTVARHGTLVPVASGNRPAWCGSHSMQDRD